MYDLIHYRDELRGFIRYLFAIYLEILLEDETQLLEEIKGCRLSTFR